MYQETRTRTQDIKVHLTCAKRYSYTTNALNILVEEISKRGTVAVATTRSREVNEL